MMFLDAKRDLIFEKLYGNKKSGSKRRRVRVKEEGKRRVRVKEEGKRRVRGR